MATTTTSGLTAGAVARGNSNHSSFGTLAPLNTPTRRFYPVHDPLEVREPGVPNPNIYVVQPFKNASVPKDLVYARKNAPNPGESLLNSTIELINHFSSCYEAVKQQLQDEHTKERESVLVSRTMTIGGTNNILSRNTIHKPAKQARFQPLILHQEDHEDDRGPFIENCIGISPLPVTKANDLAQVYDEKLRLLRKLKPELFDNQGNLRSHNATKSHSHSQASASFSKKSATSSFRTPHNTLLTNENVPFDDRRTFLTEFTNEEEDNENEGKSFPLNSIEQTHTVNELMKNNYVLKVLEIKKMTSTTSKRDRTKSASDKGNAFSRKGTLTAKST